MHVARRALILLLFASVASGCGDASGGSDVVGQPARDGRLAFADGGARADGSPGDGVADGPRDGAQSDGPSADSDATISDGASPDSPRDAAMDGPGADSTADSTAVSYTVSVSRSGPGSVSSAPAGISCGATCSASFPAGTQVTLSASPFRFCEWLSGPCTGASPTCVFTVTQNTTVSATFAPIKFGVCP